MLTNPFYSALVCTGLDFLRLEFVDQFVASASERWLGLLRWRRDTQTNANGWCLANGMEWGFELVEEGIGID